MTILSPKIADLSPIADRIIGRLLAVKPKEEILLIADSESDMDMVFSLAAAVRQAGCDYTLAIMPSRRGHRHLAHVLPRPVEQAFYGADVAIGLTRGSFAPSLAPVQTRLVFEEKKLRYYSMALRSFESMMQGGALADYDRIKKDAARLKSIFEKAGHIRVSTARGTDFSAKVPKPGDDPGFDGPFVRVEDGWAEHAGDAAAFPDGEVFFAPRQFSAEGRLLIDGPIEYVGMPSTPVEVHVEKGRISKVAGDSAEAHKLRGIIEQIEDADIIGEVAVGINPSSLRNGSAQEEKKALGNCHIGFGIARPFPRSWMAGCKTHIHSDMVIRDVIIEADGSRVVDQNRLLA